MDDVASRWKALSPDQAALADLYLRKRVALAPAEVAREPALAPEERAVRFGLFFFSDDGTCSDGDAYGLLLEAARFADCHGFDAIWIPERHFHPFGGLYPNPSVLGAALACTTSQVAIRAGSVVLPLQSPIRVAEEWAVVDRLSEGRVSISFASGWHPDDFVLAPKHYDERRDRMWADMEIVRRLWRGEAIAFPGPTGLPVEIRTYPRPIQGELPTWITAARDPENWVRAGRDGLNVLTALLTQRPNELAARIDLYHHTLREHGHRPEEMRIAVMLHTFLGVDLATAKETIRGPFCRYLRHHMELFEVLLRQEDVQINPADFGEGDREALIHMAFDRYFQTAGLLGTEETAAAMVDRLRTIGVTDIACLLDFGIPREEVLDGLVRLDRLRQRYASRPTPASFAQERMWVIDRLNPGNPAYNCAAVIRLTGPIDSAAMSASLFDVACRHEPLRTAFPAGRRGPAPIVRDSPDWRLQVLDLSSCPEGEREDELRRQIDVAASRHFDLEKGPLVHAVFFRLGVNQSAMALVFHHIVVDGWSMKIIIREVGALYRERIIGEPAALPPMPVTYSKYAAEQRQQPLDVPGAYWRAQLAGYPGPLKPPTDRPRKTGSTFPGAWHRFRLDATDADALRRLARRENATLFMVLLSAFFVLLRRWTGEADLLVGTPVANRTRPEVAGLIGYFSNTLVIRADLTDDPTFADHLARVRATCLGAYDHQEYPFEKLVEDLQPRRDPTRSPLFQVVFMLQEPHAFGELMPGVAARVENWPVQHAKFDLTVWFDDLPGDLPGVIEFNSDLFEPATIARLAETFVTLLHGIADDSVRIVSGYPLVTPAEAAELVSRWTREYRPMAVERDLCDEFATQVNRAPEALALVLGATRWTYAKLHERSNRVACSLMAEGIGPGDRVAIRMGRSPELVATILGILKAGAAYIPIDPGMPPDRQAWLAAEGGAVRTLSDSDQYDQFPPDDPPSGRTPDRPAYVIFTSGSTGRPKGVVVTHRNVVRLFRSSEPMFRFGPDDAWSFFHSPAFDFSVWELFGGILHGGSVIIVPEDGRRSPEVLSDVLAAHGATILSLTPSAFRQWSRVAVRPDHMPLPRLRLVIFGGESLDPSLLGPWFHRFGDDRPEMVNMYGITETTVHVTARRITAADIGGASLIGTPLTDLRVYLLDENRNPVPTGWVGEIYVGGGGVAEGYHNRPDLTLERFLPDPLLGELGGRIYRSGDLARQRLDGELVFHGRADDQVKVRGYRIEPREIETALLEHPRIRDCVVFAENSSHFDRLIAYLIPASEPGPNEIEVRDFLRGRLPEYMIPVAVVAVNEWPLTPSGKLNRAALPSPGAPGQVAEGLLAPRSDRERDLASVWTRLLGRQDIGVRDNFFDLGGHSLLATELVMELRGRFGIELPLSAVFDHPTIEALASAIPAEDGRR